MAYTASPVNSCRRCQSPVQLQMRRHPLRIPYYRGNRLSHHTRRWNSQDPFLTLADLPGVCDGQAASDSRRTFILPRRTSSRRKADRR